MSSFEPDFISKIAGKIVEMISDCDEEYFSKVATFYLKIIENYHLNFKSLY